jgi:hypothetical protein
VEQHHLRGVALLSFVVGLLLASLAFAAPALADSPGWSGVVKAELSDDRTYSEPEVGEITHWTQVGTLRFDGTHHELGGEEGVELSGSSLDGGDYTLDWDYTREFYGAGCQGAVETRDVDEETLFSPSALEMQKPGDGTYLLSQIGGHAEFTEAHHQTGCGGSDYTTKHQFFLGRAPCGGHPAPLLGADTLTRRGADACATPFQSGNESGERHESYCWRLTRHPDQNHDGIPDTAVTAVSPTGGPPSGGTMVNISGRSFAEQPTCFLPVGGATEVKFGSTPASSFTVNSDSSITAVAPAGTGTVDVTVIGAEGTSATSSADHYTYGFPPTVTKVAPKEWFAGSIGGPPGGNTEVTISGTNLAGATAVKFGITDAVSFTVNSATTITARSPEAMTAGIVNVRVTTPVGTSVVSKKNQFKFKPSVYVVSPNSGSKAGGYTVQIGGYGFALGAATSFTFGATKAKSVNCTASELCNVVVPKHAVGTVDVIATVGKVKSVPNGSVDHFTYN